MSGGRKQAQPAGGRSLDGGIRTVAASQQPCSPLIVVFEPAGRPNVRHERRAKGCEAGFGSPARWSGQDTRVAQTFFSKQTLVGSLAYSPNGAMRWKPYDSYSAIAER